MQPIKSLFIVALFALTSLGQSIEVKPFVADLAKSVQLEQLPNSVAVIFTERLGTRTGAYIQVTSDRKWATPVLDGVEITATKVPGQWILFAPAAKYRLLLAEFDPETGPRYTYHDLVIPGTSQPPDKPDEPVDPPPPTGDFAALKAVVDREADALNDPTTRAALAAAYKSTLGLNKPYEEQINAVKAARRLALQTRPDGSLLKTWDRWREAVDLELNRAVPAGDVRQYVSALRAIVEALESK